MIVPTFAQRPIVGYGWIVLAAVGTGFLSFGLWVHHMFTTGLPGISLGFFSAASEAVAIPDRRADFLLHRDARGRTRGPLGADAFHLGGLAIFVLGGLTGVMVALAPFDFQAHDSFFVVGHLHYVLIGGAIFPIIAGCYYFFPLINGKKLSDTLGKIAFWLMFIGFNVTFLPMHFTGLRGMPRRVFTYPAGLGFDMLNLVSTHRCFHPRRRFCHRRLGHHPPEEEAAVLRAKSVECGHARVASGNACRSHGASAPFRKSTAVIRCGTSRILCAMWMRAASICPMPKKGKRETLVTTAIDAKPVQCLRLPGPSFITALGRPDAGRLLHFRHVSSVVAGAAQRRGRARRDLALAMDRHGASSRRSRRRTSGLG